MARERGETTVTVVSYADLDRPAPRIVVFAVEGCACGEDHETIPRDATGHPLICREHKRHAPCRPCERRRVQGAWGGHV